MLKILLVLATIMPLWLKLLFYRRVMGRTTGNQVKIGLSYIQSAEVIIGDNAQTRHFNIIRGLLRFQVGSGCYIANFNQFFGNSIVYP